MISSVSGISGSVVSFHLNRNQDKGVPSLDDETFAKGLGNHPKRSSGAEDSKSNTEDSETLGPEEKAQVEELRKRDAEVRTHEMAHLAAAGSLARGGPKYVYQTGPDGRSYAIGGHVEIDTSPGRTPEETLAKAAQIRAAALAPNDPSPQDTKVAAAAARLAAEAQQKISGKSEAQPNESAPVLDGGIGDQSHAVAFKFVSELGRLGSPESEETEDKDASDKNLFGKRVNRAYSSQSHQDESFESSLDAHA